MQRRVNALGAPVNLKWWKFNADWVDDPRIQWLSPASRGILISLMCAQWRSPTGWLEYTTEQELARLGQCTVRQMRAAFKEIAVIVLVGVPMRPEPYGEFIPGIVDECAERLQFRPLEEQARLARRRYEDLVRAGQVSASRHANPSKQSVAGEHMLEHVSHHTFEHVFKNEGGDKIDIRNKEQTNVEVSLSGQELTAQDCVRKVFAYYLDKCDRNPTTYKLSVGRMRCGVARFRECLHDAGGDPAAAVGLMRLAIDRLAASPFHMGQNDRGKMYTDWQGNLFKTYEQMSRWWNDEKPRAGAATSAGANNIFEDNPATRAERELRGEA